MVPGLLHQSDDDHLLTDLLQPLADSEGPQLLRITTSDGIGVDAIARCRRPASDPAARLFTRNLRPVAGPMPHTDRLSSVRFSPNGRRVATSSWDGTAKVWSIDGAEEPLTLRGHRAWVSGCSFIPTANSLVTASWDATVRIWHLSSGEQYAVIEIPSPAVAPPVVAPDGNWIAVPAAENAVHVLRRATSSRGSSTLTGHTDRITATAASPDGLLLATSSRDGTACVWALDAETPMHVLRSGDVWVSGCAFSPDGATLATTGWDGIVRLWDVRSGSPTGRLGTSGRPLTTCTYSPDGRLVTTSGREAALTVWDPANHTILAERILGPGWLAGCAVSPDGTMIATASVDEVEAGEPTRDPVGRDVILAEGYLVRSGLRPSQLAPEAWDRLHAVALDRFGLFLAAEETGATVAVTAPVPIMLAPAPSDPSVAVADEPDAASGGADITIRPPRPSAAVEDAPEPSADPDARGGRLDALSDQDLEDLLAAAIAQRHRRQALGGTDA